MINEFVTLLVGRLTQNVSLKITNKKIKAQILLSIHADSHSFDVKLLLFNLTLSRQDQKISRKNRDSMWFELSQKSMPGKPKWGQNWKILKEQVKQMQKKSRTENTIHSFFIRTFFIRT